MRNSVYLVLRVLCAVLGAFLVCVPGSLQAASAPLPPGHPQVEGSSGAAPASPKFDFSKITKPKGGKNVEEIYQDKAKLKGKAVILRGKVVKYNEAIMGRNWLHLRDGTGKEPANDITVTTQSRAKVGDTVLVEGLLAVDKDIGAGYKYDVIVENAKVTVE